MSAGFEIQLIAILVAGACSILGVFLVLKSMAMVSDAITHTILLGIVLAFFIVHDLNSPLLIIGAGIIGVLTVYLVELLNSTRLLKEDSSIGIVFPLFFAKCKGCILLLACCSLHKHKIYLKYIFSIIT